MKFFFATRYKAGLHRPFIGPTTFRVCLQAVMVLGQNGEAFYEDNVKDTNLLQLGEALKAFLLENNDSKPIEFIGFGRQLQFIALTNLLGGIGSDHYPKGIPDCYTDLSQTIIEYMELLDDDTFGPGSPYMYEIEKVGESYTSEQKYEMFMSHVDFPDPSYDDHLGNEVHWLDKVNYFLNNHRQATFYTLKLPTLKNEDDNSQQS